MQVQILCRAEIYPLDVRRAAGFKSGAAAVMLLRGGCMS